MKTLNLDEPRDAKTVAIRLKQSELELLNKYMDDQGIPNYPAFFIQVMTKELRRWRSEADQAAYKDELNTIKRELETISQIVADKKGTYHPYKP